MRAKPRMIRRSSTPTIQFSSRGFLYDPSSTTRDMWTIAAMTMKLAPKKCRPRSTPPKVTRVHDEADAVVGVVGRGQVEECQHDAGQQLHRQQEQHDAAGDEPPSDTARQRLVEEVFHGGAEARSGVQPVAHPSRREVVHASVFSLLGSCSGSVFGVLFRLRPRAELPGRVSRWLPALAGRNSNGTVNQEPNLNTNREQRSEKREPHGAVTPAPGLGRRLSAWRS